MNHNHRRVLKLYLKYGYSRRMIENILRMTSRHGKSAQDVIDEYRLRDRTLRGRLLGCHDDQFNAVISKLEKAESKPRGSLVDEIDALIPQADLGLLTAYKNCVVLSEGAAAFHAAIKDVVANITQQVFDPCKQLVGACQNSECRKPRSASQLETAHMGKSRPTLFAEAANQAVRTNRVDGYLAYDLYLSIRLYLRKHLEFTNRVRFLCGACHDQLGNLQDNVNSADRAIREAARIELRSFKAKID